MHTLLFFCGFCAKIAGPVIFWVRTGILNRVSTDSAEKDADSRKLLVYTNLYSDILGKM